jgi:large subunit ribosomal protein L15
VITLVVKFRKKNVKQRGRKTHGWGSKKKHRGGGSQGGRGYGGSHKHKFSYIVTKEPGHFGYKGFVSRKRKKDIMINIDEAEKLAGEKNEINLTEMGYTKLLGAGSLSKPLNIKISKFSKNAKEKVEKAGGKIIS